MKFSEMTRAEKRVAIAKDVIKSLKLKKYIAEEGLYVEFDNFSEFKPEESVQTILRSKKAPVCNVCALGACFLSMVKFENKVTVLDLEQKGFDSHKENKKSPNSAFRGRLEKYFSKKQLGIIESVFESSFSYSNRAGLPEEISNKAASYAYVHDLYGDDDEKLIHIMENIVKNKGTFKL